MECEGVQAAAALRPHYFCFVPNQTSAIVPIIRKAALGPREARSGRVVRQYFVAAVKIQQWFDLIAPETHVGHRAYKNRMRMHRYDIGDLAVEARQGARQGRRAGDERHPLCPSSDNLRQMAV